MQKKIYFTVIVDSHLKVKQQNQEPEKQAFYHYILHRLRNSDQRKKNKKTKISIEKRKFFFSIDHVLIYIENPKECGRKYQNLIKFRSFNPK